MFTILCSKCIANHVDTIGLGMFANSGFGTTVIELYQYSTRDWRILSKASFDDKRSNVEPSSLHIMDMNAIDPRLTFFWKKERSLQRAQTILSIRNPLVSAIVASNVMAVCHHWARMLHHCARMPSSLCKNRDGSSSEQRRGLCPVVVRQFIQVYIYYYTWVRHDDDDDDAWRAIAVQRWCSSS